MTEPFNQFLLGRSLRKAGSTLTVPASAVSKTRSTILGRVGARSVCRMTLRYPFLLGTRNLESKERDA